MYASILKKKYKMDLVASLVLYDMGAKSKEWLKMIFER